MTGADVLSLLSTVTFVAAGIAAVRLWIVHRTRQSAFLAGTFAALDSVILLGLVIPDDPVWWITGLLVGVLVAFPYLLFRFADSMVETHPRTRRAALIMWVAVTLMSFIPGILSADPEQARTPLQTVYLLVLTAEWLGLTVSAGWVLMRVRTGAPGLVRNRMALLAAGAWAIGAAILLSVGGALSTGSSTEAEPTAITIMTSLLAILSGITFLIGFAPPRWLLTAWRADAEKHLFEAAVRFLSAENADDVLRELLPDLQAVLGAEGIVLLDEDQHVLASIGDVDHGTDDVQTLPVGPRTIALRVTPTMPLFGDGVTSIDRLGLLSQLAADRSEVLQSEREARSEIELANEQLASVNAELEAFVYTTSHDLKNPVIAMLGYIDLLQTEHAQDLPEDVQHYLGRLASNAQYIEALLQDLLELSRVGRLETEPARVAVATLVTEIERSLQQRYPDLSIECRDFPVDLWMNPTRARQLLTNLCENAASHAGRPDVRVTIAGRIDDDGLRLRVADNGVGIPEEHLKRVFGLFERLYPDSSAGTGIGLAICKRITESVDGSIVALPSDDGALIEINLPLTCVAPTPAAATTVGAGT